MAIDLEYGLLVPRRPVRFRAVEGTFENLSGAEVKLSPVVRTDGDDYCFEGFESGVRSGLLRIDGKTLKIKGCTIGPAFQSDGLYRTTRDGNFRGADPYGGQVLSDAQNELRWLSVYNQILSKEGFPHCQERFGYMHYFKDFKPDRRQDWDISVLLIEGILWLLDSKQDDRNHWTEKIFNVGLSEEGLTASVMEIKGDTRLPELYGQRVTNANAESELAYGFGIMAGAQKRLTEGTFLWGFGNSHDGNYVVFSEGTNIHLTMADFDGSSKYNAVMNLANIPNILARQLFGGYIPVCHTKRSSEKLRILDFQYIIPHLFFRERFIQGFNQGYKNPDKRVILTLEMLCEAYDLESAHSVHV